MTKFCIIITVLTLILISTSFAAIQTGQPRFSIFGTMNTNNEVKITSTVPYIIGQTYGWIINLAPSDRGKYTEIIELPSAPASWGEDSLKISNNGRTCTSTWRIAAGDEIIYNIWEIVPGDPTGEYNIKVYINNELIETFRFLVKKQ